MVKGSTDHTADESDADVVQEWMEKAPTRRSFMRGKYKTYRGAPCKTAEEKKQAQAAAYKKWKEA